MFGRSVYFSRYCDADVLLPAQFLPCCFGVARNLNHVVLYCMFADAHLFCPFSCTLKAALHRICSLCSPFACNVHNLANASRLFCQVAPTSPESLRSLSPVVLVWQMRSMILHCLSCLHMHTVLLIHSFDKLLCLWFVRYVHCLRAVRRILQMLRDCFAMWKSDLFNV